MTDINAICGNCGYRYGEHQFDVKQCPLKESTTIGKERYEWDITIFQEQLETKEQVHHPEHYGGVDNPYEAIKVIEAWGLGFCLGNTVKYISRAGNKFPDKELEDLKKAAWYLSREIKNKEMQRRKPCE